MAIMTGMDKKEGFAGQPGLRAELEQIISPDRILDTELVREVYARDASYFDLKPLAVVRPRTTAEVSGLIALCRRRNIPVTFRAGGTSLSGQSVNTGLICELRTDWKRYDIRQGGSKVWFEPGITAATLNAYLQPHHRHIGPDPASSSAAMMGGILANNSSGMSAGVRFNSYHTLSSIEFILPDGNRYLSSSPADRKRFELEERDLCAGLMQIRDEILADPLTVARIRRKYEIKNVTGYAMNSFLDYDHPMDIFAHLLIGSEGTLAYIVSGELDTLPLDDVYSSTMLYFPDVTAAASHAAWLGDTGARCVEMMDYASLRSYLGKKLDMPAGTTALLVDYGASSPGEMAEKTAALEPRLRALRHLCRMDAFTHTVAQREALWKMRDGIFPCVAGVRTPGATVILEDVVAHVAELDRLVGGVQRLFVKHGYDGAIFGHARDGNIHPLLTTPVVTPADVDRFRHFMYDFVDHVLSMDGSLKGEHGTGRAIAPFVGREWGDKVYGMMKRVKQLCDPQGIFNPGVIINADQDCFLRPLKTMPLFGRDLGYERADMCMECGYCEHVCPTRDITFTPRQRLQALRVIAARPGDERLRKQYRYFGEESCCSDASCMMPCPMDISTAAVTDAVRSRTYPKAFKKALQASASRYGTVEDVVRGLLRAAVATEKVISPYPLIWATDFMHRLYHQVPHWSRHFPMPAALHYHDEAHPEFLYFPACVTRIFGASSLGKDDVVTVVLRVAARAGLRVSLPKEMHGLCCSQIWEHKGDPEGQRIAANRTVERFYELSDGGSIPIFCDTASCTHVMFTSMPAALTEDNKRKFNCLKVMDMVEWLAREVMPRLRVVRRKRSVLLHPTCAGRLLKLVPLMEELAAQCADKVTCPVNCQCCGAAGDRGFLYPEVAKSATSNERREIEGESYDGCYSMARTCEISMMDTIGWPYESLIYLIDETTASLHKE